MRFEQLTCATSSRSDRTTSLPIWLQKKNCRSFNSKQLQWTC